MNPILRILLGLFVAFLGFLIIWKTRGVMGWVGRIPWAEEKLGSGGTYSFLKIIGVIVIFIGFMITTNIINDLIGGIVGIIIPSP